EDGIRDFHVTGVQTCALPISIRNGVSVASLKQANGLGSSDRIYAGQQLQIGRPARAPVTRAAALASYRVRPGDTVWTISRATGRSEERRVGNECEGLGSRSAS